MKNWVFFIKIAANGLKIEEKCQKMSKKNSIFPIFQSKFPQKTTKEIHFLSKTFYSGRFCDYF